LNAHTYRLLEGCRQRHGLAATGLGL